MNRAKLDEIKDGGYGLDKITCIYTQGPACADETDATQAIQLETVSNGYDSYINISLPDGGHWSIDDIDGFIDLLKDFKTRFEYDSEDKKSDTSCGNNVDYVEVVDMSDADKLKMYMERCSKEQLAKMLLQANKEIDLLAKHVQSTYKPLT